MVGSRGSAPTGRFTYTTYRLPTGTPTVYSISTKDHTSWLRNSFSWHAVADICCLRQQNAIFHYFHNLSLCQKLDPRLHLHPSLRFSGSSNHLIHAFLAVASLGNLCPPKVLHLGTQQSVPRLFLLRLSMPPTATHQQDNSYGRSAIWRVSKFLIPLIAESQNGLTPKNKNKMSLHHTAYEKKLSEINLCLRCITELGYMHGLCTDGHCQ